MYIYTRMRLCGYILYAEEVHAGSWNWREAISRMSWGLDFSIISWFWLFGRLVSFLKSQGCIIPRFTGEKHGHCPNSHDLIFVSRMVKLRRLVSQTQYLVNTVYIYIYLYTFVFFLNVFSPKSIMIFPHLFGVFPPSHPLALNLNDRGSMAPGLNGDTAMAQDTGGNMKHFLGVNIWCT